MGSLYLYLIYIYIYIYEPTYTKLPDLKYLVLAMEFNETLWFVLHTGTYTFICSEVTLRKVVVIVFIT